MVRNTAQHGCMLIIGSNGRIEWQVYGRTSTFLAPVVHNDVEQYTRQANELLDLLNMENFRVCTGYKDADETPGRQRSIVCFSD